MSRAIRQAEISDLDVINRIYNQAVATKLQTADQAPIKIDQRKAWFDNHDRNRYLIHVLEVNHIIVGWSSLSKYREGRGALNNTAEISYYIDSYHQGKGHGSYLFEKTIEKARKVGFKNLVALLLSSNKSSIGLLEKYAFKEWGRIPNSAEIEGELFDHLYYGRSIV